MTSTSTSPGPASGTKTGRVLALDLGARRIGVAVSDPLRIIAQGLPTLEASGRKVALAALARLVEEQGVTRIVVGLPLRLSGEEGPEALAARTFAADLTRRLDLPVELWDERLTTVQAERTLLEGNMRRDRRRQERDRLAAILILQGWLDAHAVSGAS
ncbi:MAG: Holliday junction resolvase RuvX [Acidobacteria bacterium]|nr:Holliday junction resolvase RuvX [Acidobacteriota bacterium]MCZ6650892.1 Holliday junction resolvase RuvX [Acidobacteriota bacterium]MCZ6832847.1 Holliday junction resolvase RuvX [Acidobacteriota bacterium]